MFSERRTQIEHPGVQEFFPDRRDMGQIGNQSRSAEFDADHHCHTLGLLAPSVEWLRGVYGRSDGQKSLMMHSARLALSALRMEWGKQGA